MLFSQHIIQELYENLFGIYFCIENSINIPERSINIIQFIQRTLTGYQNSRFVIDRSIYICHYSSRAINRDVARV